MAEYFYLDAQGRQQGPIAPERMAALGVTQNTLVWTNGMPDWKAAGMISELRPYVSGMQTPPNPPKSQAEPQTAHQQQPNYQQPVYCPDNHMTGAILTTIFCCLPTGIVAIVYASKVNSYCMMGNMQQAYIAASNAKTWTLVSLLLGIFTFLGFSLLALI